MPVDAVEIPQGLISPGGAALYETDLFRPTYRPMQGARWRLVVAPLSISSGYWSGPQVITNMAVLVRDEGDGKGVRTWMSMTPMEIESQELGCRAAFGHTVVMGLGMNGLGHRQRGPSAGCHRRDGGRVRPPGHRDDRRDRRFRAVAA